MIFKDFSANIDRVWDAISTLMEPNRGRDLTGCKVEDDVVGEKEVGLPSSTKDEMLAIFLTLVNGNVSRCFASARSSRYPNTCVC